MRKRQGGYKRSSQFGKSIPRSLPYGVKFNKTQGVLAQNVLPNGEGTSFYALVQYNPFDAAAPVIGDTNYVYKGITVDKVWISVQPFYQTGQPAIYEQGITVGVVPVKGDQFSAAPTMQDLQQYFVSQPTNKVRLFVTREGSYTTDDGGNYMKYTNYAPRRQGQVWAFNKAQRQNIERQAGLPEDIVYDCFIVNLKIITSFDNTNNGIQLRLSLGASGTLHIV